MQDQHFGDFTLKENGVFYLDTNKRIPERFYKYASFIIGSTTFSIRQGADFSVLLSR